MDHESWLVDHESWTVDHGSMIMAHGLWIMDHGFRIMGSWIVDHGSQIVDHGSRIMDHESWLLDHGSWIVDCGSWIMHHGSWTMDLGLWILDPGEENLHLPQAELSYSCVELYLDLHLPAHAPDKSRATRTRVGERRALVPQGRLGTSLSPTPKTSLRSQPWASNPSVREEKYQE
ncbi:hypothetical protein TURU_063729 [Turdus rufiventris]|nr:hypothetical protein TURU_063729 [Turdus rufiventris]